MISKQINLGLRTIILKMQKKDLIPFAVETYDNKHMNAIHCDSINFDLIIIMNLFYTDIKMHRGLRGFEPKLIHVY